MKPFQAARGISGSGGLKRIDPPGDAATSWLPVLARGVPGGIGQKNPTSPPHEWPAGDQFSCTADFTAATSLRILPTSGWTSSMRSCSSWERRSIRFPCSLSVLNSESCRAEMRCIHQKQTGQQARLKIEHQRATWLGMTTKGPYRLQDCIRTSRMTEPISDTANDPRQPIRLEKNANIASAPSNPCAAILRSAT